MLDRLGIAENPERIGSPRSIQFFEIGFQDSHKYVEELGPGMCEPRRMVAVVIDKPERRPLLKRLIARFPEALGDPAGRSRVLAPPYDRRRYRTQNDQPHSNHSHRLALAGLDV